MNWHGPQRRKRPPKRCVSTRDAWLKRWRVAGLEDGTPEGAWLSKGDAQKLAKRCGTD